MQFDRLLSQYMVTDNEKNAADLEKSIHFGSLTKDLKHPRNLANVESILQSKLSTLIIGDDGMAKLFNTCLEHPRYLNVVPLRHQDLADAAKPC